MHFLVTIGYETDRQDREGNARLQKLKYILEAETAEEAIIVASKYRAGDARASQSISLAKLAIECVIDRETMPQYYK